jgi:hypothetical protein
MCARKSGQVAKAGRSVRGLAAPLAGVLVVGMVLWAGQWALARSRLKLQNHVAQTVEVPGAPSGPLAQAADGRLFVVTAEQQLVSLEHDGAFAWNKRLPRPVTPVPVVVGNELIVLVGQGVLLGFSLGGEERFSAPADTEVGDLISADGKGHLFLLDGRGSLVVLDERGQKLARTSLGLREHRRLIVLPSGQIMGVGTRGDGAHQMFWAEASGLVTIRSLLPAAPVGLSLSGRRGEAVGITAGSELWTLAAEGPPEQLVRRLTLPGPAVSAPLLPSEGGAYVLIRRDDREALCHLDDSSQPSFCAPTGEDAVPAADWAALPRQPTLARNGLVYVPFAEGGRLAPSFHGVLAADDRGVIYRQQLPGTLAAVATTVDRSGALWMGTAGQRYLFRLDSGRGDQDSAYAPWPQPLGSPAATSHGWN